MLSLRCNTFDIQGTPDLLSTCAVQLEKILRKEWRDINHFQIRNQFIFTQLTIPLNN